MDDVRSGRTADAHDAGGIPAGSGFDREFVDLALSVNAAVRWSFSFADGEVTWMAGMDALLGIPDAPDADVRTLLFELIAPLTTAARSTTVWQDLELEQSCPTPSGQVQLIRFAARRFDDDRGGGLIGIATDVTASYGDRQQVADLADRYRLLVELSPDAVCVHQNGIVTYVNPATVKMLAAESDEQLLEHPITDFLGEQSLAQVQQRVKTLTTPGAASAPAEAELLRFDGGRVVVEAVSVRTTWEGRAAYQVIMRDVTAQKAAESALHYQAALVQHVSDAIIATTRDGIVTSWNPAAAAVYGLPAEQAVGREVSDLVGAPLVPAAVLADGGITESVHRRTDGSTLVIRVSVAEMEDGFVLMCADETARRRAEQHYATVVDALDEGVVVVDATGVIESANPAAQSILGASESEIVGSTTVSWHVFDEAGDPVPPSTNPAVQTQRTGEPQNSRVVRVQRADGRNVWLAVSSRPLVNDDSAPYSVVASFTDITERRAISERLEREATHDPLTGLANRTVVLQRLGAVLHSSPPVQPMTVLFIDLDKFKVINDSLGHGVGDKVLQIAGERLRRVTRHDDLVGRLGGDEFVVVTDGGNDHGAISALTERLRGALTEPIQVDDRALHVDASIGIVQVLSDDTRTAEDVLRDSDVAMYQAKVLGRGRHAFFDVELRERLQRQMYLEQDLREAAQQDQFWLAYQPIVDLRTDVIVGVEGLLRWAHPVHGTVSPGEFIPLAEESDLINRIGAHMVRMATRDMTQHSRDRFSLQLNVNLSARQLDDPGLLPSVRKALVETGLPAQSLCLEVTESALMRDSATAARTLGELRELGALLAIDDFGTGYSSLAQLQSLPLDSLKIDRSFVAKLGGSADAEAIVTSIIAMAHAVNLTVVAEGAETAQQLGILKRLGCDRAQGFYLGRPAPIEELFDTDAGPNLRAQPRALGRPARKQRQKH